MDDEPALMSEREHERDGDVELRQLAEGGGVMLVGRVLGRGSRLLGQVVVARLVGLEAFGLYAVGWTILQVVSLFAPLGLDRGVVRYGARHQGEPDRLRAFLGQSIGLALVSGLALAALLYVAAPWMESRLFADPGLTPVIRWFAAALPALCVLRVATSATTISRRMSYGVYAEELTLPVATLLCVALFFYAGWGLLGTIAAMAVGAVLAMVVALAFVRRLYPAAFAPGVRATREVGSLLRFSLPAAMAGVFTALMYRVDRLILGSLRPAVEVGQYQAVAQLSLTFALFASAFNTIFAPLVTDLHSRGEKERLSQVFRASARWGIYTSLPLALIFGILPGETVSLIFGAGFRPASDALVVLAIGQFFAVATAGVPFLIIMSGHERLWTALAAPAFLLNVALDFALIPRFGMLGAALGTALSQILLFSAGLVAAKARLDLWPFDLSLGKGGVATVAGALGLLALRAALGPGAWSTVVLIAAAFLVTWGALWALGLRREDREMVVGLLRRLRR